MRLRTINEALNKPTHIIVKTGEKVNTILGKMDRYKAVPIAEALSMDMKPAEFNNNLKKALRAAGAEIKSVNVINSYNWPNCSVQVYGKVPNDIRLAILKVMYPGLKWKDQYGTEKDLGISNMDDINYGNITSTSVSAPAKIWAEVLA